MDLKKYIREIPDWPQQGVNFKDITPLLQDKEAFRYAIDWLAEPYRNQNIDAVVGIDARGFILSAAVAYALHTGLALVRKKGKLPREIVSREYVLEYASNTIEMHKDAITAGQRVLVIDDVLATGGTCEATAGIIETLGGVIVGISFLIELTFLRGKEKLARYPVRSLIYY